MNSQAIGVLAAPAGDLVGPGWAMPELPATPAQFGAGMAGRGDLSGVPDVFNGPGLEPAQPVNSVEHINTPGSTIEQPGDRLTGIEAGNFPAMRQPDRSLSADALRHLNLPPMAAKFAALENDAAFERAHHQVKGPVGSSDRLMKSISTFANNAETEFSILTVNMPELKTNGNFIQNQAKFYGQVLEVQRTMLKFQMHLSCAEAVQSVPKKVTDTITNMQS
jgi:hypothetical protein